jgi:stearoyl-CoA desaturase (delta-9 desaturase)
MNQKMSWLTIPIIFMSYVSAFVLTVYCIYINDYTALVAALVYQKIAVGLFGNQIAQHRYFSHRSFTTTKIWHYLLGFFSTLTATSPITYASIHRHHHVHSDTDQDVHSPRRDFWYSALYWPFTDLSGLKIRPATDLVRDPYLRWLHANINVITVVFVTVLCIIDPLYGAIYIAAVGFNNLDATVVRSALVHTQLPGSYRTYNTEDASWNNMWLQLYHWSEGLHNNHHAFPNRYNTTLLWYEFDLAGWCVHYFIREKND